MPGYMVFYKYTQQGIATIKQGPERTKQTRAEAEKMGIRMVGVWLTMGEYDVVAIFDAPDDKTMASLVLDIAKKGNVTTKTVRAFSEEEFAEIVGRLP